MVIFLYGPDAYRRQEKLLEYRARYQVKFQGFSLRSFDLEDTQEREAAKYFLRSQSLFESSRFGILSNINEIPKVEQKEWATALKELLAAKDITLVFNEAKAPIKEFNFLLQDPAIVYEFADLKGPEFQAFVKVEARKRDMVIDIGGEYALMQLFTGNTWGLVTELDRLALLGKKTITKFIVEAYASGEAPLNLFTAINKLRDFRSVSARLAALEELFFRAGDPAMIFNIAAVSPYADEAWKKKMADYDVAIKSGKLEYEEVLTDLALSL